MEGNKKQHALSDLARGPANRMLTSLWVQIPGPGLKAFRNRYPYKQSSMEEQFPAKESVAGSTPAAKNPG